MSDHTKALIVVDMIKDYFTKEKNYPITPLARETITPINKLIHKFRKRHLPVIFTTDAFGENDFFFKGKMNPHAIKGSNGAEVIDELDMKESDLWIRKPKFSAFFNTGLEKELRRKNITTVAVAGIATNFCVITTVMDALCYDFEAVLLEDCTAAFSTRIHEQCISLYRNTPLYPLFRVMDSAEFSKEMAS